jgi:hypothetical protein
LNLLTDDGVLGYIVPSKFAKVGAGMKLRELLANHLIEIMSFGANQIFKDKTTYTCLLFLTKQPQSIFYYAEIRKLETLKQRKLEKVEFSSKRISELSSNVWTLVSPDLERAYSMIMAQSIALENLIGSENIFNGIQTSATNIYIHKPIKEDNIYYSFVKNNKIWKVEKELTRPYYQTARDDEALCTYRPFVPNSFVIYPYKNTNGKIILVDINELKNSYPFVYEYLLNFKSELIKRDIQPIPKTNDEWYRYGRHQSLDKCEVDTKIVVGILSQNDGYAIDYNKTVLSSGGNAGYCIISYNDEKKYSIYYLQAILNSKYVEWICSLFGSEFRGGYISHGTQVLKKLPIRLIDFENATEKAIHDKIAEIQKKLIHIYGEIDSNSGNKRISTILTTQFTQEKSKLENLLVELYNLGDDDKLIPLIKELYEIN